MSLGNKTGDGDKNLCLQSEDSEISSLLNKFPASTNVLVVDDDIITLLNMKTLMKRCSYQVTVYASANEAILFLTTCENKINIVIWDFHMPEINGLQALKIIGSKMDLPVIIMSNDSQTESVMNANKHGACDYVLKPVNENFIANIWKHIVPKRMMSKPGLIPPVQLDVIENDSLNHEIDDSMIGNQGNSEQNIHNMTEEKVTKKPQLTRVGETQPIEPDLVQSNSSDQDNDNSRTISQHNGSEQHIDDKNNENKSRKPRLSWTGDLQLKFLEALDILGGPEKAIPTSLLKCLQEMNIKGLTKNNVASHLQQHRINLKGNLIYQKSREIDWSSAYRPSPLVGLNNGHNVTSSLMNGQAIYLVHDSQYHCTNQFMTNTMPCLPNFDHDHHQLQQLQQQQQQHHQLPHQLSSMIRTKESGQTSDNDVTDPDPFCQSLPYDPNDFFYNGYNSSK